MPSLSDLDPASREAVEAAALDEIHHFRAEGNPDAIVKLALAGREAEADPQGEALSVLVSDSMEEMAADLRARQRDIIAAFGSLGAVARLMVRS